MPYENTNTIADFHRKLEKRIQKPKHLSQDNEFCEDNEISAESLSPGSDRHSLNEDINYKKLDGPSSAFHIIEGLVRSLSKNPVYQILLSVINPISTRMQQRMLDLRDLKQEESLGISTSFADLLEYATKV